MRVSHKVLLGSTVLLLLIILAGVSSTISLNRVGTVVDQFFTLSEETQSSEQIFATVQKIANDTANYVMASNEELAQQIKSDISVLYYLIEDLESKVSDESRMASVQTLYEQEEALANYFDKLYEYLTEREATLKNEVFAPSDKIMAILDDVGEATALSGESDPALASANVRGNFLKALINLNIYLRTHESAAFVNYTNAISAFQEEEELLEFYLTNESHIEKVSAISPLLEQFKKGFTKADSRYEDIKKLDAKLKESMAYLNQTVYELNKSVKDDENAYRDVVGNDISFSTKLSWIIMAVGAAMAVAITAYVSLSTNSVIRKMAQGFSGTFDAIKSVGVNSADVASRSTQMEQSAQSAHQSSSSASRNMQELTTNVNEVSTSIEEMDVSISEIASRVGQSVKLVTDVANHAATTTEVVNQLEKNSQQINDVIDLINGLADQTNLLALNASIEAARAGDAGAGFAVVAEEVKKLAIETTNATGSISKQIDAMQAVSKKAVSSIAAISNSVKETQEISSAIEVSIQEQREAASVISNNMVSASQRTTEVNGEMSGIQKVMTDTGESSSVLMRAAQDMQQQSKTMEQNAADFLARLKKI